MRAFLWVLSGIGVLWFVLSLVILPQLWGLMDGEMTAGGGAMPTLGAGTIAGVMLLVVVHLLVMLGLVGLFVYLVVDSLRARRPRPAAESRPPA